MTKDQTSFSSKQIHKQCLGLVPGGHLEFRFDTSDDRKVAVNALGRSINIDRKALKKDGYVLLTDNGTHIYATCIQTE